MSQTSQELASGHVLQSRYTILKMVGGGGMGTVYKATDFRVPNRYVAIKEMKQENLTSEELASIRNRFLQETAILSSLQHPNLPRVYDSFEEQGRSYLVMEFIEGITLSEQVRRMRGLPLPTELVLEYALQLCNVLSYLHNQRPSIIFRDLKPANVMVTPKGEIFLIDFGIARHFKEGQSVDTEAFGTKGYMAPEVGIRQTDARADLYSLGVTLHYCLTCQTPNYVEQGSQFPSTRSYNAQVPPELDVLILKMVEYSRRQRPRSAEKVKQQLEHIQLAVSVGAAGALDPNAPTEPFNRSPTLHPIPQPISLQEKWEDLLQFAQDLFQPTQSPWQRVQSSLKTTRTWTPRLLLLWGALLIGAVLLSMYTYRVTGGSYYRVELVLVFALLISLIVISGRTLHPVPRNILLCTGISLTFSLLALLAQWITNGTKRPLTLSELLTYTIGTMALLALIGKASEAKQPYTVSPPPRWFTRLSHLAMAGVALLCLFLQSTSGNREQVPFVSITHPLTTSVLHTLMFNDLFVYILGGIASFSLLRLTLPFSRFDRTLLLLMSLLYLPLQYTFGLAEIAHTFAKANAPTLATINTLLMMTPVVLALLALFPLRRQLEWLHQLALCALAVCSGWLQDFQAAQRPSSAFSVTASQLTNRLLHLAALGEFIFYSMGIAITILALRALFFWMFQQYNVVDRIAVPVVACGCVLIQWSFWQAAMQQGEFSFSSELGTRMLYGNTLSFYTGWFLVLVALLAIVLAVVNALFQLPKQYSWLEQAERVLDRVTVLITVGIALLLLVFFGDHSKWLVASFNMRVLLPNASLATIPYKSFFLLLLGLFGIIVLIRWRYTFGWAERVSILLSGVVCLLILIGAGTMQNLPLLSADMQQATGNALFALTIDSVIDTSILAATLFSFFWLTRIQNRTDRTILGLMLAMATVNLLYQYIHIQHILLLATLIMLMLSTFIAAQIERM